MRMTSLFIVGATLFSIVSCSSHSSAETAASDTAVNSTICDNDTVESARGNIIETYTNLNDGSTLTIDNRTSSGPLVNISLFRLTDIDGGIGKMVNGALTFTATDAAGQPIGGRITFDGDTAHMTFTESSWEYLPKGSTCSFVRGAKVDYEPANPVGGRTYAGSGNGGGLATNVTIKFDKGGKCQCISDFYQAFSEPETVNGTYSIRYDIVEVHCQPEGFNSRIAWNLEIINDGQELGFNNSDASE